MCCNVVNPQILILNLFDASCHSIPTFFVTGIIHAGSLFVIHSIIFVEISDNHLSFVMS